MRTGWTKQKGQFIYAYMAALILVITSSSAVHGATMLDYCVKPPLIGASLQPNMMLMLDNSSSMYDLGYQSSGSQGTCSGNGALCAANTDCPDGQTCGGIATTTATYCYDNTFNSKTSYFGYFDASDQSGNTTYYKYDFVGRSFAKTASLPASCDIRVAATLCLDDADPPTASDDIKVTKNLMNGPQYGTFIASGNYLNWLTQSKLDIEKKVLTGGKYSADGQMLIAESRGCVGYRFVKEANTGDYIPGVTPTSLGVTFAINGPTDPYNPTAPSPGGTTNIEVFIGDYNEGTCQAAIDAIATNAGNAAIKKAVGDCLTSTGAVSAKCSKDASMTCAFDSDCIVLPAGQCTLGTDGSCNIQNNGVCDVSTAGTCGGGATGVCTNYSTTASCSGNAGVKVCVDAGPLNGKSCGNKSDCALTCTAGDPTKIGMLSSCTVASNNSVECALPNTCSAGDVAKIGTVCANNSDCDAKWCTNAGIRYHQACTTPVGCNTSTCSNAGTRFGTLCSTNAECSSNTCSAGDPAKLGAYCTANADCDNNKGPCLVPGSSLQSKTGPVFNQSMQACWAYNSGTALGGDDANTVKNQCSGVYTLLKACIGGLHDGRSCSTNADCTVGGVAATCGTGADAVRPGNSALLCGKSFSGYCADPGAGIAPTGDWATTNWQPREYASINECILQKHKEYCNVMDASPVTDPSGDLSQTSTYGNVPAIISGTGVVAQLGDPIGMLQTRITTATAPEGLIQQFKDYVRMGAMSFRLNGSPTECLVSASKIPCPKKCSTSPDPNNPILCATRYDCPSPAAATCDPFTDNKDGAKILNYIGYGHCSVTTTTECATAAHCPAGEKCVSDGVGDHATSGSLVKQIDDLRATSWTPFSEGLYDAMGYFAKKDGDATGKFSRTDLRINSDPDPTKSDYRDDLNPSEYKCQRNNILFLTDGMSTADMNPKVLDVVRSNFPTSDLSLDTTYSPAGDTCAYAGSKNFDNIADLIRNYNIRTLNATGTTTKPTTALFRQDYVNVHVVLNSASTSTTAVGQCNAETLLTAAATKGGTILQKAHDPAQLQQALSDAFQKIAADTVSGTAASVLASGEGSGANLVQAVFYPNKEFENKTSASWIGRLANMWYYVDPLFSNSNIREDDGDRVLTSKTDATKKDYVTQLYFDVNLQTAMANRWTDANGDGSTVGETQFPPIKVDAVSNLWEAGKLLWATAAPSRNVLTSNVSGAATSNNLMSFTTANASILRPYLQAATEEGASTIIQWTRGNDNPSAGWYTPTNYRKRTVKIGGASGVWKLGDILNSTPKISSWQPLNDYHKIYGKQFMGNGSPYESTYGPPGTTPYQSDAVDTRYYITAYRYKGRGMVYAGSNDGMLHAFRLGLLEQRWAGQQANEKGRLTAKVCTNNENYMCSSDAQCGGSGTCSITKTLGEEVWAFIPKNMLPYLRYMTDPSYCHIYGVDLTPFIFDASIGYPSTCTQDHYSKCIRTKDSWRTLLIGGMRTGGACRRSVAVCTDCVKAPTDDPANPNKALGYSSYFALNITDQNEPQLMWEYDGTVKTTQSDGTTAYPNRLGFSTSAPAIIRINADDVNNPGTPDQTRNGKWFVMFASGPTGPIEVSSAQFLGRSEQNLFLHIFDLADGPGVDNANVFVKDTGIINAFGGSLYNSTHDVDLDYTDEAVYFPYISYATADQNYRGGVGRLLTRKKLDPTQWEWTYLVQNTGPVTSSITRVQNEEKKQLWILFGSGRYFFAKGGSADDPDPPKRRQLFGMKDPCLNAAGNGYTVPCPTATAFCDSPVSTAACGGLTNVDNVNVSLSINPTDSAYNGWYIDLDPATEYPLPATADTKMYYGERVITDPMASANGVVYFTSFRPYNDPCDMGGITHLWAVMYNTGGPTGGLLKGKAIIQVSTGSIEQIDLAAAFAEGGGRKSAGIRGVPPQAQGLSVMSSPRAARKVVHIKER